MKIFTPILFIVLVACSAPSNERDFTVLLRDSLKTDQLLPNTFVFSSQVIQHNDSYFYWDNNKTHVIQLDSKFKYVRSWGNVGDAPEAIPFFSNFSIVDNYLFICGNQCLAYDFTGEQFLGKFKLTIGEVDWIVKYADKFVMGGLNQLDDSYSIFSASFDKTNGFSPLQKEAEVEFDPKLDYVCKTTTALVNQDQLILLKKDIGELEVLDKDFGLQKSFKLPYSFTKEENMDVLEDETYVVKKIEAWSMTKCDNYIFINRSADLNTGIEKNKFKRVHCFDNELAYVGGFLLKKGAIFISCDSANRLMVNKMNHETLYTYEIQ